MIAEAVLLLVLAATMFRRGRRLRSLTASLVGIVLLVPSAGLVIGAIGVAVHPIAQAVAVLTQGIVTLGVVIEEVAEERLQARLAHADRTVEATRRRSASARARAYTALQRVEDAYGCR